MPLFSRLLALFRIISFACFLQVSRSSAKLSIRLWEHTEMTGRQIYFEDLDQAGKYGTMVDLTGKLSSFIFVVGSCVRFYPEVPPGKSFFWTSDRRMPRFPDGFNDRVNSAKRCDTRTVNVLCPNGTFVKQMDWGGVWGGESSFKIYCSQPGNLGTDNVVSFHRSNLLNHHEKCTVVQGLTFKINTDTETQHLDKIACDKKQFVAGTLRCPHKEAMTGMQIQQENFSHFVKSVTIRCTRVLSAIEKCIPDDKKVKLLSCDALNAQAPFKCSHAKTIGMAQRKSLSATERAEFTLSSTVGSEVEGEIPLVAKAKFSATLGVSATTGYDWTETQESEFYKEVTIQTEVVAHPGCIATIWEILGECGIYHARPNYFVREDKCKGDKAVKSHGRIVTRSMTEGVFRIPTPDVILQQMWKKSRGKKSLDDSAFVILPTPGKPGEVEIFGQDGDEVKGSSKTGVFWDVEESGVRPHDKQNGTDKTRESFSNGDVGVDRHGRKKGGGSERALTDLQ